MPVVRYLHGTRRSTQWQIARQLLPDKSLIDSDASRVYQHGIETITQRATNVDRMLA